MAQASLSDKVSTERTVPVVAIREGVVFPHTEALLTFGRPKSVAGVNASYKSDRLICFVSQRNPQVTDPDENQLYKIGTLAIIERILRSDREVNALVKGIARVRVEEIMTHEPFMIGRVSEVPEITEHGSEITNLSKHLLTLLKQAVGMGKPVDMMTLRKIMAESESEIDPIELSDHVAYILELKTSDKQKLLATASVKERMQKIIDYLSREIKVLELEQTIASKTQQKFEKSMKEAVLRERKKTIEEELGELGEEEGEIKELREKIKKAKMPAEAAEKASKELERLAKMAPHNPEAAYIRTYLDWLVELPWSIISPNDKDLTAAAKILDEDHYGLKKVKERVVEYLAVMRLKEKQRGKLAKELKERAEEREKAIREEIGGPTILCFVGPPGVGKTSIGKSIARALGRKFIRMSLGGIRDEAEIRGHRRTYVGAMPGRIVQGIKTAGTANPVFMLDEIDKVGADFRGDPSAALLEALDPEQNYQFSDHYLEIPFDLSRVMFITTANVLDTIPPALRDRMEVIRFPGYTEEEKFHIGRDFLWGKQLRFNGLKEGSVKLTEPALSEIIRRYTREAGVRELERNLATLCRKIARRVAERKKLPEEVKKSDLQKYLGPAKFSSMIAEKKDEVGMATGLAYTEAGGDILFIEVALMPGKGKLFLTGKLGEVMKESGQAALSYTRSRWNLLGLKEKFYDKLDVHVHVPEGAVPKDGPSAGAAIGVAIVSALSKIAVRREVGLTGEITLRGRVLEVGGIKEKVIAAHRAGLKKVVLPKDNKKDLEDVPKKVKKDIKFVFVEHMDEVLKVALSSKRKVRVKIKAVDGDRSRRRVPATLSG